MNHHRFRKQLMWHLGQGQTLRRSDAFHATAESEFMDIRRLGFKQPVFVVPNGIDVPPVTEKLARGRRRLLCLGRIHRKKGIDLLLRAWRAVQERFADWEVVIAGPDDDGELPRLRRLASGLGVSRVNFVGPVYGEEKLALYRSSHLFVLSSHSENFALTVAEALATGTPAIVTRGAPWQGLVDSGAGWWIEIGVDPLVACLEEALSLSSGRLVAMGQIGRDWMTRDFSWEAIGRQMVSVYEWLRGRGPTPLCVRQ
jgi:glycosyltransferase involved in cell wall biosynthesis